MAKIWVKGYTKPDGTKVKGHYRGVSAKNNINKAISDMKATGVSVMHRKSGSKSVISWNDGKRHWGSVSYGKKPDARVFQRLAEATGWIKNTQK